MNGQQKYPDSVVLTEAQMVAFDGMTYDEVGRELFIPTGTVAWHMKSRLKRINPALYATVRSAVQQRSYRLNDEGSIYDV